MYSLNAGKVWTSGPHTGQSLQLKVSLDEEIRQPNYVSIYICITTMQ